MRILSCGLGVQTTSMLYMFGKSYDYVIFADTGGEHQETYDYMRDHVIPFCKNNNIRFVVTHNKYGKTLYQYCFDKRIVPSIKFRDCTSKFKIAPIRRFIRKELKVTRKDPITLDIGISFDEIERMHESNVQYIKNNYPLIDLKMSREDCKKKILELGFPIPPKSGCTFCPFANSKDLIDPRYVEQTITLEENNSRFPEIKLRGIGLKLKTVREMRDSKDNEQIDSCKSGYCMT